MTKDKFLYFSFGSNLSPERIKIKNRSAQFYSVGLLKGYRFAFQGYSEFWKGSTANIIKDDQAEVYGIIWELDQDDLSNLDDQELHYGRIEVNVLNSSNELCKCWTYTEFDYYAARTGPDGKVCPSLKYKQIVITGAKLNKFPQNYLKMLENYEDNGITDCGPKLESIDNQYKTNGLGEMKN